MTEASKLKEEAKKNIRSLLQSAQGGRTLHELRNDYKDFFFSDLPGREFGYSSPEDFLKDIPDVAEIIYSGGTLIFKAVASASTAHIQRLVSLNKPKKKPSSARSRHIPFRSTPPPPSKRSWAPPPPRFQRAYQNAPAFQPDYHKRPLHVQNAMHHGSSSQPHFMNQGYHSRPAPSQNQARHRTVPTIPAFIQGQIHGLLDSNPHGLPLTHFCRVFKLRFQASLEPQQMGFRDEHEMLASIPGIASLKQFPQGEVRVIVARRENCKPSLQRQISTESSEKSNDVNHNKASKSFTKSCELKVNDTHEARSPDHVENWDDLFVNHTCNIPTIVQEKIKKLIEKRPEGIYASSLASAYKDDFNEMLHFKTYGYNSVIDFVSDLSNIVNIERPNPQGDWMLFPANTNANARSKHEDMRENQPDAICTFTAVEDELKECICQVLEAHPNGILLEHFHKTFQEMTGLALDIKKYGNGTLKQFLHTLSDILNIVLDASDNLKVCAKFQQGPRRFDKLLDNYRPITDVEEASEPILDLPADTVTPGCYYKPLPLPKLSESVENYVELYVSYVINPSCFWIQLRGERTTLALEELMDDLEKHYKEKSSRKYHMPPSLAKEGTLCAAIYPEDSFWYRAIILGYEHPLYKVYYVDYGNTCTVTIDNIRLLKRRLMKLPAQAIKARLSNIQPLTQKWTGHARDRMLEMCREIPLIGLVSGIKERTMSLCLTDTRGLDDIHINDMLVMEKYAKFVPDQDGQDVALGQGQQGPTSQMLFGEGRSSDSDGNASGGPVRRYIRQAQINDDLILNLINLNGKGLYLISAEISSLFFKEDIISSMLVKDNAKIQKVVVAKTNYPDLYNELLQYETPWVSESTTRLGLYPLKGLPLIIDLYGQSRDMLDLKDTVLEILVWFEPDDPYWKGEDDLNTESDETEPQQDSQSVTSDSSETITLEDLTQALNILQMKRKQVLRKIMTNNGNVDELVNELNGYELSIKRVEERKAKQESLEAADKKSVMDDKASDISQANSRTSGMSQPKSSLSALSATSAPPVAAPTTASQMAADASVPISGLAAMTMTPQQQQNLLLNSMYMSSFGMLPNLSQSALHSLSTAALDKNLPSANQLPNYLQQSPFNQGLTGASTTQAQLGNLGLLANHNLTSQISGAGRGVGLPQYPTLTPSQMTALNQAMLASTPQIYNSQLLSMPGSVLPLRPPGNMPASGLHGLTNAALAQSLLQQNMSNQAKKS